MKYTILGFGARGSLYANMLARIGAELTAVCEARSDRLENAGALYGLGKNRLFNSYKDFAAAGKFGELCIVATQDEQHKEHALAALDAGYELLLEKPVAANWEDCRAVYDKAKKLKRRVFVCHTNRYAPFFRLIKDELDTGVYGRAAAINTTENVGYWHYAHSFVRGNWRVSPPSAPMILAKCCHDLDIISWFAGAECTAVSSNGSLGFFTPENAPPGSSGRCTDCAVRAGCPYDAERFYIKELFDCGKTWWPVDVLCENPTREKLMEAVKTGPYGRCVWKCGNNVVDRQIVNMEFAGGLTAHLTMTAFSADCYRQMHVHCERGEIFGNTRDNTVTFNIYGGSRRTVDVKKFADDKYGHGGGDFLMLADIAAAYGGKKGASLTSIENSMQSHAIGFAAEESRRNGGKAVPPYKL
jgi:predicted dehydrogenase